MTRVIPADPRSRIGWTPDTCRTCSHPADAHSQVLDDHPCLDCDCPTYTIVVRPSPTVATGRGCVFCRSSWVYFGFEYRRVGRIPWKRLVHTNGCPTRDQRDHE